MRSRTGLQMRCDKSRINGESSGTPDRGMKTSGVNVTDLWHAIAADTKRQFGRSSVIAAEAGFFVRRNYRACLTLRLCQWARAARSGGQFVLPFARLAHRMAAGLACIDLRWNVDAGVGLAITHGWGLVVSPGTRIGRNVTLFHGATLGRSDRLTSTGVRTTGFPVIEDAVWIGPHAVIVGDVRISEGSRIAAGAFVTEDVPAYSVVIGNPVVVVRSACTPDVMNRTD